MARPADRNDSLYFDYPHYPFVRPAELEGRTLRYPAVVVGAGPVGVTAALELARHGVRSVVLDDKDTVNDGSRAICIARHSLEILQQLGVSDRFVAKALGWTRGTSYYRDRPVYRLAMPHGENERFYPMYNIQQQYIEKFLIDAAAESDLVELRWQSRLIDIRQHDDGVELNVDTPEGRYTLPADYVLAADGARSTARRSLDLELEGDAYRGRYVIVDIRMASDYPTERRAFFDPPSNPGLTILIHKQPDDIWRIDYQIREDEDEAEVLAEANVRARITAILEMIGETGPWELEWWSMYTAYTLALDDYRHGRVLFLGDAAHLVPIFGVRGLNSGFADAANAAWKLAYVIRGWAPEGLLDSYSPERRGATLDIFDNAAKSTKFMTPPTRGYRLLRDAALSLAVGNEFTKPLINPRQSQPYTYSDSPLTGFLQRDAEFTCGPRAGAALENHRIGPDHYLLDALGLGFTGLYFSATFAEHMLPQDLFEKMAVGDEAFRLLIVTRQARTGDRAMIGDPDGRLFEHYGAQHGSFYLVRPDRHICARWRSWQADEVRLAFARALGNHHA